MVKYISIFFLCLTLTQYTKAAAYHPAIRSARTAVRDFTSLNLAIASSSCSPFEKARHHYIRRTEGLWCDNILLAPPCPANSEATKVSRYKKKDRPVELTLSKTPLSKTECPISSVCYPQTVEKTRFYSFLSFSQFFGTYYVIDTEATGLGHDHALTDVACVEVQNFVRTGSFFQAYVNPECEVTPVAHRITGYTLSFLEKYPVFKSTAPHFFKYLGNSPLVIHNKHFDLKLLNQQGGLSYLLEDKHVVVDTELLARKLHPGKKSGLTAMCAYFGINTKKRVLHGALLDSEMLAALFCKMFRKNKSVFPPYIDWQNIPRINFFGRFVSLPQNEPKISSDLISTIRYDPNLYHPTIYKNFPATLIPFCNYQKEILGVLVDYIINSIPEGYIEESREKHFYGNPENTFAPIKDGGLSELFVTDKIDTAIILNTLFTGEHKGKIRRTLNLENEYSILSVLDERLLPAIILPSQTRKLTLVIDEFTTENCTIQDNLKKCIESIYSSHFLNLFDALLQSDLTNYVVLYKNVTWNVKSDYQEEGMRKIKLVNDEQNDIIIVVDEHNLMVSIGKLRITSSNTEMYFSLHAFDLKLMVLNFKDDTEMTTQTLLKMHPEKLIKNVCRLFPIKYVSDVDWLDIMLTEKPHSFFGNDTVDLCGNLEVSYLEMIASLENKLSRNSINFLLDKINEIEKLEHDLIDRECRKAQNSEVDEQYIHILNQINVQHLKELFDI